MQSTTKRRIGKRPILSPITQKLVLSEFEECKAFWDYCQRILRLGMAIYHIPNEGKRDEWLLRALINIGLTPGILDYHYIPRNEKYYGLWFDMKRTDQVNKPKNDNQERCIEMLLKNGHYATYAYGCDHAIKIYTDYVNNRL